MRSLDFNTGRDIRWVIVLCDLRWVRDKVTSLFLCVWEIRVGYRVYRELRGVGGIGGMLIGRDGGCMGIFS